MNILEETAKQVETPEILKQQSVTVPFEGYHHIVRQVAVRGTVEVEGMYRIRSTHRFGQTSWRGKDLLVIEHGNCWEAVDYREKPAKEQNA